LDTNSFQFPTKGEMAVKSLFAGSQEQRDLARLLMASTPAKRDDQHSFFDVANIDLTLSPIGRQILEIVEAQLIEACDPLEMAESLEELLDQNLPSAPAAPVADPPKTLEERTSLDVRIKQHGKEGPEIARPPKQILPTDWKLPKPPEPWDPANDIEPMY
jgi:hypothetical protein